MRILLIQGHPDRSPGRYLRALANAYREGALEKGHELRVLDLAEIQVPLLRSSEEWQSRRMAPSIREAQELIRWARHLVLFYPLWLGEMPALVKAFLEQALRPGFAMQLQENGRWKKLLGGRSARVVISMGMPAPVYRWYFGAHSLKSLERNILGFCGIRPVRHTLVGNVEACSAVERALQLRRMRALGRRGG
jgi:putative NADPH-quinone reductase